MEANETTSNEGLPAINWSSENLKGASTLRKLLSHVEKDMQGNYEICWGFYYAYSVHAARRGGLFIFDYFDIFPSGLASIREKSRKQTRQIITIQQEMINRIMVPELKKSSVAGVTSMKNSLHPWLFHMMFVCSIHYTKTTDLLLTWSFWMSFIFGIFIWFGPGQKGSFICRLRPKHPTGGKGVSGPGGVT